ncbi:MAG TPA: thiamine-phosphate kinase [Planctomycetota bacterium]|nr:thiamine-phosphate kinase [Planctomycetota bacterium]
MSGELDLLKWIHGRLGRRRGPIVVDSGDDAAVLRVGRERLLFKVDSVVEGVHFTRGTPPEKIGYKALARPLSDIAAMGGVPVAALAAAVLPRSWPLARAKRLQLGMERLGVPVVGGDITTHRGPLMVSVSVLGDMKGAAPVLRKGARPGDVLLVTGPLGGSIHGKHLVFEPRLEEGRLFATRLRVHAMIDISDGFARDLGHLCAASGVGAVLDRIPIMDGSTLRGALYDGEDYELIVAASPATARRIEREGWAMRVGEVCKAKGIRLLSSGGIVRKIMPRGYEHPLV